VRKMARSNRSGRAEPCRRPYLKVCCDCATMVAPCVTSLWTAVFWVVTACNLMGGYQRFGRTNRFHILKQKPTIKNLFL
jgi:hypothetical protein